MPPYRLPSALTESAPAGLAVTNATRDDWHTVEPWIEQQGWDPGVSDADQFYAVDPAGFFVGRLGSEIVSAIAVVNYDDSFAYLGHYMVRPDHRGRGYGVATWNAAIGHAGSRTIGLESGEEHLAKYRRSGFADAYRTRHYAGRVKPTSMPAGVSPVVDCDPVALAAYDAQTFPADRSAFVLGWIDAPGHRAYVRLSDGHLTGYGVIRSAVSGYRIGPLVADSVGDAQALFDALTVGVGSAEVSLETPLPNAEAAALAESYGLGAVYETVRMYNGPVRPVAHERNFAIASFELG
jgi:GNAT superfamily N-acetyltransferase